LPVYLQLGFYVMFRECVDLEVASPCNASPEIRNTIQRVLEFKGKSDYIVLYMNRVANRQMGKFGFGDFK
jgi:hypothetical protein